MSQTSHRLETKHTCAALDRVDGTEDSVNLSAAHLLIGLRLDSEQPIAENADILSGLLTELVVEGGEIHS